jgi:ATP-dependent Clp protease ATP-binding subunit ClpC
MVRFDMSEFQERHTVSRLVGAPPGYVGYEEAGQLTEQVRRRPYSVLLFDEIEKAHPDIFNILLQILDDGRLTDAQGRTVDFKNAVVIMTSNLGADRIQQYARQGGDFDELRDELMEALRQNFRPEFINRIDDIIVFRALDDVQLAEITKLLLDKLVRRMRAQRIEVEFTDEAVQLLAREGYDPEFGARPLRRTIQRLVENELSRMVLDESVKEGDKIVVEAEGDELRFEVESGAAELEPAEQEEAVPTA